MCAPQATQTTAAEPKLAKHDEWLKDVDLDAFAADVRRLGDELEKGQGPADARHFDKMVMWSNACGLTGLLTMGLGVNLLSVVAMSTFTFTRGFMVSHFACHGGYERCHPDGRWSRFRFAIGGLWRRWRDWFDWLLPEAWNVSHNNRHHYFLSEHGDPDLVEENLVHFRDWDAPVWVKCLPVPFLVATFKWANFAPNMYKELKIARWRRAGRKVPEGVDPSEDVTLLTLLKGGTPFYSLSEFFSVVLGPYLLVHFFLLPMPLLVLGEYLGTGHGMYVSAVKNLFLAELLTNVHAFCAGVTNHAGEDMYRFRTSCRPHSGSFYLRQVLASVDFTTGSDLNDFAFGYMNYQVEHHLWPSLSMLSYQRAQPLVKALCKKHGVPYKQENVARRVKKTIDIMTGAASMRWFPEEYERKFLGQDAAAETAKKNKKAVLLSDKCMEAVLH